MINLAKTILSNIIIPRPLSKIVYSLIGWHMPVIPALLSKRQNDQKFKSNLSHITILRAAWATLSPVQNKVNK